jgi:hypothetical protein
MIIAELGEWMAGVLRSADIPEPSESDARE